MFNKYRGKVEGIIQRYGINCNVSSHISNSLIHRKHFWAPDRHWTSNLWLYRGPTRPVGFARCKATNFDVHGVHLHVRRIGCLRNLCSQSVLQSVIFWATLIPGNFQFASMMYKCVHNKVVVYLSDIFSTTSSVHNHNLRNSTHALFVPRPNNESGKRSFSFRGAVLWNSLPKACQVARNYANFLRSLP